MSKVSRALHIQALRWLIGWAYVAQGLCAIVSFGLWTPWLDGKFILSLLELAPNGK